MTDTPTLLHDTARIETASASRYLQQLCKHFAHKLPVEHDAAAGRITFSIGECRLAADAAALDLALSAPSAEDMVQLKDVVVRHLERFAFREPLQVSWSTPPAG
ncbi:DUF2218 domain-containing protein [Xanthobacter sp. V3C-3]|uniref:DUF2218 domain-containing protein n=1 Tax=Xanthobacter lutulentifluminis TaxID=3119935 RepID=UPI00372C14AC